MQKVWCGGGGHLPFWLDVGAGPDVVLGGQDKLIVQDPFRLVI